MIGLTAAQGRREILNVTHAASMQNGPRYAIYFTPPTDGPLHRFGEAVIERRGALPTGLSDMLSSTVQAEPRRYGFHATLKAPFALAGGQSEAFLLAHAQAFARERRPVLLPALAVALMGDFVALVCVTPPDALSELAAACVRTFEPYRAALSEHDRLRRLSAPLTPRQIRNLDAWGYPYVFEEFVFHMTLTGRLQADIRLPVRDLLCAAYATIAGAAAIDSISVLRQPTREALFQVLARFPLGPA